MVGPGVLTVVLHDVDEDGLLDVVVSSSDLLPARSIRNQGGATFGAAVPLAGDGSLVWDVADLDGDLDVDVPKRAPDGSLVVNRNANRFGAGYCGAAGLHSGGNTGRITASGSAAVMDNDVQLRVERLPVSTFGFFLIADGQGFAANPGGSQGDLCLSGAIGRLLQGPGAAFLTGVDGAAQVSLDLTRVPTPLGAMAFVPGDTRFAQAWFRDDNPAATSNFTNGFVLGFE